MFQVDTVVTGHNFWDVLSEFGRVWTQILAPSLTLLVGALVAKLLKKLNVNQTAATNAAVASADIAAESNRLHGVTINAIKEEGHRTHLLVNSQKTALEEQNEKLRLMLEASGIEVPNHLKAVDSSRNPTGDK
jgi:hypothetical protein